MENFNKSFYILLFLLYVLVWSWPTKIADIVVKPKTTDTAISVITIKDNAIPIIPTPIIVQNNYGEDFRNIFHNHLGMKEKPMGSNSGPGVDTLLAYCNLPPGNQWCAATCSKMMGLAKVANPKSGWTPSLVPKEKIIYKSGDSWPLFLKKYQYQIKDMVLIGSIYVAAKKRDGHCFGVIDIIDEYVYSYEGNVNDMMLAKKRHYSTISKICNFTPHENTY